MPLLFSYGTLQHEHIQRATFGRALRGERDELPAFALSQIVASDGQVYANVRVDGNAESRVGGAVFEVTDAELAAADRYEQDAAYKRIEVTLVSGKRAWVYLAP